LMGGRGGIRTSGLQQQLAQAGRGLESDIAALQAQHQLRTGALAQGAEGLRQSALGQQLHYGLQPRFDTMFQPQAPRQPGFGAQMGAGLGAGLGQAAGMLPMMALQSMFR
jgi:hypothetical protein